MIELVSAFTPVVLTEYGRSAWASSVRAPVPTGRDHQMRVAEDVSAQPEPMELRQVGGIFDYMAERVRLTLASASEGDLGAV